MTKMDGEKVERQGLETIHNWKRADGHGKSSDGWRFASKAGA